MGNLQILITDSSAEFLDALTERLRGDFSVATCQDGRQAWEMIQAEQPGIYLLGHRLYFCLLVGNFSDLMKVG